MSERYSRLYALPERLYTEGAPVLILAGALLKDNQTGRVLAQLKFRSLSAVPIRALKISLRAFDVTGTELHGVAEQQYLDLDVRLGASFGEKTAVFLQDSVTRSFSCACTAAVFADGSTWTAAEDAVWEPLHPQQPLKTALGGLELLDQYRRETSQRAEYVVTEDRGLWLCACGTPNPKTEVTCMSCGTNRERVLAALDVKALQVHADELAAEKARKAEEKAKRAAEKAEQAKKEKTSRKKKLILSGAVAVAIVTMLIVLMQVIIPNSKYNAAVRLYEAEEYDEAIAAFAELDGYKDSAEQIVLIKEAKKEAAYQDALHSLDSERYDEAAAAFQNLAGYKDAAMMEKESRYRKAEKYFEDANYRSAVPILEGLEDYKDSVEKIEECYSLYYGEIYESLKNASVGSLITFGTFEQDGDTSNGEEPISWYVCNITRDTASNKVHAELMSRDAILSYSTKWRAFYSNWDESDLCRYINDSLDNAFNEEEEKFVSESYYGKIGIPYYDWAEHSSVPLRCRPTKLVKEQYRPDFESAYCAWPVRDYKIAKPDSYRIVDNEGNISNSYTFGEYARLGIRVTIDVEIPKLS